MNRCIGLLRVSSDKQDYEHQKSSIVEYAIKNQLHIEDKDFIEEFDVSGYKTKFEDRVGLQKIIKMATRNEFDILLTFESSRIGRRTELLQFISLLTELNIKIISVTEGLLNNKNDDTSELMSFIRLWNGSMESKKLSERVRSGKKNNYLKKEYVGGRIALGYKIENKRITVDKEKVHIIKNVFDIYINKGSSYVLDYLKENNITNINNRPFSRQSVTNMIKNRNYIGYRISKVYGTEDYIEELQIIDDETFDRANKIMKNRTIRKNGTLKYTNRNEEDIYEGLIFHKCEDNTLHKLHISYTYCNNKKYKILRCDYCKDKKIEGKKSYGANRVYEKLKEVIENGFHKMIISQRLNDEYHNETDYKQELESKIKQLDKLMIDKKKALEGANDTLEKVFSGQLQLDITVVTNLISNLNKDIVAYKCEIESLNKRLKFEKSSNKNKINDDYDNLFKLYKIASNENKKKILLEIIDKITIDKKDNIDIYMKRYREDI